MFWVLLLLNLVQLCIQAGSKIKLAPYTLTAKFLSGIIYISNNQQNTEIFELVVPRHLEQKKWHIRLSGAQAKLKKRRQFVLCLPMMGLSLTGLRSHSFLLVEKSFPILFFTYQLSCKSRYQCPMFLSTLRLFCQRFVFEMVIIHLDRFQRRLNATEMPNRKPTKKELANFYS